MSRVPKAQLFQDFIVSEFKVVKGTVNHNREPVKIQEIYA